MPESSSSPVRFVEVWQTSTSSKEVSRRLGSRIKPESCLRRAGRYRQMGVELKFMQEPSERIDAKKLNAVIRSGAAKQRKK